MGFFSKTEYASLILGGRRLRFETKDDLDFVLSIRTQMIAKRLLSLRELNHRALGFADTTLRTADTRVATALALKQAAPAPWLDGGNTTCPRPFADDHGWRDILCAALEMPGRHALFRDLILLRYLEYLRHCRHMVAYLNDLGEVSQLHPSHADDGVPPGAMETIIDSSDPATVAPRAAALPRLIRGKTVCRRLAAGKRLPIRLGGHWFTLDHSQGWFLVGANGAGQRLRRGKLVVGRHPSSDIVIDPGFRGVSRRHAVLELAGQDEFCITDFSATGTFMSADAIV